MDSLSIDKKLTFNDSKPEYYAQSQSESNQESSGRKIFETGKNAVSLRDRNPTVGLGLRPQAG